MMHQNNIAVRTDVVLAGMLSAVVRSRARSHARGLSDCARGQSPEAVRRLRTATRRLSGVLDLAVRLLPRGALKRCRKRLRSRLRRLSAVRDIDTARSFIGSHPSPNPSLVLYDVELADQRHRSASGSRDWFAPDATCAAPTAYAANHIAGMDQAAIAAALAQHLDRTIARVLKARSDARMDDVSSIHRLRIAFRRLRYAAEVLQPVLVGFTRDHMDAMHRFHSLLGRIQDLRVIGRGLERFGRTRNQVVRDELAPVAESIRQERAGLIAGIEQTANSALSYWINQPIPDHCEGTP